jgi:hypothetical protein
LADIGFGQHEHESNGKKSRDGENGLQRLLPLPSASRSRLLARAFSARLGAHLSFPENHAQHGRAFLVRRRTKKKACFFWWLIGFSRPARA